MYIHVYVYIYVCHVKLHVPAREFIKVQFFQIFFFKIKIYLREKRYYGVPHVFCTPSYTGIYMSNVHTHIQHTHHTTYNTHDMCGKHVMHTGMHSSVSTCSYCRIMLMHTLHFIFILSRVYTHHL